MKNRIWAIIEVGRYLGKEEMLKQIKPEEEAEMKAYIRKYYYNAHGLSQEKEMEIATYMQEGAELGWEYVNAIRDYLYR